MKDCGHHECGKKERIKKISLAILIFIYAVGIIMLIIWAVFRPIKPKFILQDATVYNFNVTGTTMLTSLIQITILSRNPSTREGLYYDKMIAYTTYRDQQITIPTGIPPTYQDIKEINIWSPYLQGYSIPIAPYIGVRINQDCSMGSLYLVIKFDGRLRFKIGGYISRSRLLHVSCPAVIPFGNADAGILVGHNAVKYQLAQNCKVTV